MARRRKKNKKVRAAGFVFPTPLATILILAAVLALSYLYLCGRCDALGKRIKKYEEQLSEVRERRFREECRWANMKSPPNMSRALSRHGLVMTWPDKSHVIYVPYSACRFEEEATLLAANGRDALHMVMND